MRTEKSQAPQILLVDDNPTNLQVLYQTLDGHGYRLLVAKSGKDALAIAERAAPDLIMLDVMMPEMDGFETCARLKASARSRDAAVIFLSALTEAGDKVHGLELGGVDFVTKPFQAEEVLARVRTHLRIRSLEHQLRRRNEELEHELTVAQELLREASDRTDGVQLGDSPAAQRLRQEISTTALIDDALLISGPPGSDHEAVARAVHHQSSRSSHALIYVSCLTVSPDSAAQGERAAPVDVLSKVSLADGGTLYLEAIQFLSHGVQRKLAELLGGLDLARQSGEVLQPDIRVIVSTTRSIDEELAAGRVLPELRRRLRRTIDLPPLRDRVQDLPALTRHILERQAEQTGRLVPQIAADALDRLKAYRWPGNLRELRNVLECAVATSQGGGALDISEQLLNDGLKVGSYRLIERIGSGGMGEVWLARHQLLARPAAIKLLRLTAAGEDEEERTVRQRFEREANATAELQSPHTVQLYDFGITDTGNFYYVMERLQGMDLQRIVERFGPLPLSRAIFFLKQACRSLSEAHALGLVHRDIKPANLFVCRLGREYDFLKVLDFGMVSGHARVQAGHVTIAGTVLGTPAFLPPELALNAAPFDGRADIYSLGCVAFWLLTGRQPFEADDPMTLLMHHAKTPASPPSLFTEEHIPPEMDAVILQCLAKDAKQRPASADALWDLLNELQISVPWNQAQAQRWWDQHAPEMVEQS